MRIALLSPLYESVPPKLYGGTERIVAGLCQGLMQAGHEVELFASGDSTTGAKTTAVIGRALRLREIPLEDTGPCHFTMLAEVAKRAGDFDVIHNHHDYWMLPLTEMTDTPVVTTVHWRADVPELISAYSSFPRAKYISISDHQRSPAPTLNWLRTVYHGIDLDQFKFYPEQGKYLAFLGRIGPEKRPDWAIQMAMKSGIPLKIAAKIEGKFGQEYYDTYVKPYVDGKFIEYIGEISDSEKSEFLGNALALVFPIDWPEPFGLVMIEALACGTPVLARPCGSVAEILENGTTGFVHSDVETLADHVKDLSRVSRLRCRQWVEEKFSLQRMTEDYIRVYRYLTSRQYGTHYHRWNLLHSVKRFGHGNS